MEISYLEIFHKQGILGLSIWAWLFASLWKRFYIRIGRDFKLINYKDETFAFFISAAFMFAISLTNPFINSPMGLGMLAIALICLQIPPKEVQK
jgi:O-antigen ligase